MFASPPSALFISVFFNQPVFHTALQIRLGLHNCPKENLWVLPVQDLYRHQPAYAARYCYGLSVSLSICLSIHHTRVLYRNKCTYCQTFHRLVVA